MLRILSILLAISCLALFSCESGRVYERNSNVGKVWHWDKAQTFELAVTDTAANYDLFLNVRHYSDFGFSNLWVNIRTIFPNGDSTSARVEIPLAESDGQWIGACSGSLCFRRDLIAVFRKFPQRGLYRFEIEQDTRESELKGIRDIGIRIEKVPISPAAP